MSKCLIVLDHSFRLNSLMLKFAFSTYDEVSIVFVSNWYYNKKAKSLYLNKDTSFFEESINYFSYKLNKKYNQNLFVLKSENPVDEIENFCIENNVDNIIYDLPLFSDKLKFTNKVSVIEIDNDSYIPECSKMTAKSRWTYWDNNRLKKDQVFVKEKNIVFYSSIGEKYKTNIKKAKETCIILKDRLSKLKLIIENYSLKRNSRNGSSQLSKYLHHGIIDCRELTHAVLSQTKNKIEKDNKFIPFLRQLAFREICIRKIRLKNISLFDNTKILCEKILDKTSLDNILNNNFNSVFTKEDLFNGNTGIEKLDSEVNLCIKNRWMPNRARMWFAGECYWGLGGGTKSLEILIDFFNTFCDDAQSPNNIISCVESFRLQYGKVMKLNEKRTFSLLEENI